MKRRWYIGLGICVLVPAVILAVVASYTSLPPLDDRKTSTAFEQTNGTRLGRAIGQRLAAHPGKSGIHPLAESHAAFAARMHLASVADRSLDIQYYIWENDVSGNLLLGALLDAAERGVRVRLLLDDNGIAGLDDTLAALDAHRNIEVRLFNPFVLRQARWLGYLTDFFRLNRRMHNKSFTADNQATIVGGRNVGDAYFGATDGVLFVDLDVLAVGPIVQDVSRDFDRYWASKSAYPADRLLAPAGPDGAEALPGIESPAYRAAASAYLHAVRDAPLRRQLVEGRVPLEWASTRLVSDDPAKGLGRAAPETRVSEKLRRILGRPLSSIDLVSAYFVPTRAGTDAFTAMAEDGVEVRVLTNSLEATDITPVYAGYAKWRVPLLEAGVGLYELRRRSSGTGQLKAPGTFGSSGASLHAKTFAVDRSRVFVGSFNFDPRSINLNTEMGLVIDSPALAANISAMFDNAVSATAYRLRLSESGGLYWVEHRNGDPVLHQAAPGTGVWKRATTRVLSWLPIDWLL